MQLPKIGDQAVARCHGLGVPPSPFLNEKRIARINAAGYEGREIAGALHVVRPGDRVLELGAGLGIVGGVVALNAFPLRVVSYEANPALIPHIRALHALNGIESVIEVRNAVLVAGPDRPSTLPFHVRPSYLGSSLDGHGARVVETVEVPTADLAGVMAEVRPDVMLVDIEGGELAILKAIDLDGVRAIVIEFHPESYGFAGTQDCKRVLRRAGFERIEEHSTRTVWTCARKL